MKRLRNALIATLTLIILIQISCSKDKGNTSEEMERLYSEVDMEIAKAPVYDSLKNIKIGDLLKQLNNTSDNQHRIIIIDDIVNEYESYNADSALYYVQMGLDVIPDDNSESDLKFEIKKADILAHAGLFTDALDLLGNIDSKRLSRELLEEYYYTYSTTYQYLCESTEGSAHSIDYERMREQYSDSLRGIAREGEFNYAVYCITDQARNGDGPNALEKLKDCLKNYNSGEREYSILASIISDIAKRNDDIDTYKHYIALSAISDAKGAIKENMSYREMANVAFSEGDAKRANNYLKKSFEDANFFSARMRKDQSSKILLSIDGAYSDLQNELYRQQRNSLIYISILALLIAASALLILMQKNKLHRRNKEINKVNEELTQMSAQLRRSNDSLNESNEQLQQTNILLKDANKTKEQYSAVFLETCSSTINTLIQSYQSLKVLTNQPGSNAKLLKKINSMEFIEEVPREFYKKFDNAILEIYPAFPDKVNQLLKPEEGITILPGESFNTELRLLALIRIGISENSKIAEFLRCSLSTIYTYRSKLRKRALNPDTFEEDVKLIGL